MREKLLTIMLAISLCLNTVNASFIFATDDNDITGSLNIKDVILEDISENENSSFAYKLDSNNQATITSYTGSSTNVTIPSTIDGYEVKKIDKNIFNKSSLIESIVISDGIESILSGAFASCSSVKEITIPESVVIIGENAFGECEALEEIYIPGNVKNINNICLGCSSLRNIKVNEESPYFKDINGVLFSKDESTLIFYPPAKEEKEYTVPENTKYLNKYAFYKCNNLENITLNNITTIDDKAFYNCQSLSSLNLSKSLSSIHTDAIYECNNLNAINIDESNNIYKSVDGVLFNKEVSRLIFFPRAKGGEYIMPDSTKYVSVSAFENTNITGITLSKNLRLISEDMFYGCTFLENVKMFDSVTAIGENAFLNCSNLKDINLSSNITQIGASAFKNCTMLSKIKLPNGITTIDDGTFSGCFSLTDVKLNENIINLGDNAFAKCISLENIEIPKSLESISPSAFSNCDLLNMCVRKNSYAEEYCKELGIKFNYVKHKVTFNPNFEDAETSYIEVEDSEKINEPTVSRNGEYIFDGWYDEADKKWDFDNDEVTDNITLYAKWINNNKYTLNFETNCNEKIKQQLVPYNSLTEPPNILRRGYTLDGWYKDSEFKNKWNFNEDRITEDTTIYAKWTKIAIKSIKINYNKKKTLPIGSKVTLKATILPNDVLNKTIKWSAYNKKAKVNNNGQVIFSSVGNVTIIAKAENASASIKFKIVPRKVSNIKLNSKKRKVTIKITKTKGAKKYEIYRSTKKNKGYIKIKTTSRLKYTTKKLRKGKRYYFKVRGINGKYKGEFSKIKSIVIK